MARPRTTPEQKKVKQAEAYKRWYDKNKDKERVRSKTAYHKDIEASRAAQRVKNKKYRDKPKSKYDTYKYNAGRRGYDFNLTYEQFMTFWQQDCYYCGSNQETVGIDRVDNTVGYQMDNVVSCCRYCNLAKRAETKEDFINWARRLVAHQDKLDNKTQLGYKIEACEGTPVPPMDWPVDLDLSTIRKGTHNE